MWSVEELFREKHAFQLHDPIYQVFLQAYYVHPHEFVALDIILEAGRRYKGIVLPRQKKNRSDAKWPVKRQFSPTDLAQDRSFWELFQLSILEVSDEWERDQECETPTKEPKYKPTSDVMLRRFVKFLVFITMRFAECYQMAVGLGSCLYTYNPREACWLVNLYDEAVFHNIRKNAYDRIKDQLQKRFNHFLKNLSKSVNTVSKNEHETVKEAMAVYTPWGAECFKVPPDENLIDNIPEEQPRPAPEDDKPPPTLNLELERQRMHALCCTKCAGIEKLVEQWNHLYAGRPEEQLTSPKEMLKLPMFNIDTRESDDNQFDPLADHKHLDYLRIHLQRTIEQISPNLKFNLIRNLREDLGRRQSSHFDSLQICIDGIELVQCSGVSESFLSFCIPWATIRIQVFGRDNVGELPLSIFYIPDIDDDDRPQELMQVTESGATITLTISPIPREKAYRIHLHCWPEETLVPKNSEWYEAAMTTALRDMELSQITDDTVLYAAAQQRLQTLYQAWQLMQQQQTATAINETETHQPFPLHVLVQWLSELWQPEWSTVPVMAADVSEESKSFNLEYGEVTVTCSWQPSYGGVPAHISLKWEANLTIIGDLWVQFRQPDTGKLLAEHRLHYPLGGSTTFEQEELGFDPSRDSWGMSVTLRREVA